MRRDPEVVKTPPEPGEIAAPRRDFRRHLQGYEVGLLTVGMVLTFAWLALPRASIPDTLPLPLVDHAEASRNALAERELCQQAEAAGLPFEVRAVGESIRHFGRSVVRGVDTTHDREDIRERLKVALAKGQQAQLLRLRAVQTEYFLRAVEQAETSGQPSAELEELGGDFLTQAKQNGWLDSRGRIVLDVSVRRVLFHMHWADLVERRSVFPFAPSLNDWRIYYGFLLRHPQHEAGPSGEPSVDAARLHVVNALSHKDPEYPGFFAKGYLLYRLGESAAAAEAFRAHLGQHESGPYALLARNYLLHTLQAAPTE